MFKSKGKSAAFLLAVIMVITSLPAFSLASGTGIPPGTETSGNGLDNTATSPGALAEGETVIYNLGTREIKVGYPGNTEAQQFFDERGNFEIPLEDNAFFPYEVQFTANGDVFTEWFDTPDDEAEIDGHEFTVRTEQNDPDRFSQIGIWLDGEYIAAKPRPKRFTNFPIMRSMLPFQRVDLYLDLTGVTNDIFKIEDITFETILSNGTSGTPGYPQPAGGDTRIALVGIGGDYTVMEPVDEIDMQKVFDSYINSYMNGIEPRIIDMVVGSGKQLDPDNIHYNVQIYIQPLPVVEDVSFYDEAGAPVTFVDVLDNHYFNGNFSSMHARYFDKDVPGQMLTPRITISDLYWDNYNIIAVDGSYDNAEEALARLEDRPSLNITSSIFGLASDADYPPFTVEYHPEWSGNDDIGLVFYEKEEAGWIAPDAVPVGFYEVTFDIAQDDTYTQNTVVSRGDLNNEYDESLIRSPDYVDTSLEDVSNYGDPHIFTFHLNNNDAIKDEYYANFYYHVGGEDAADPVAEGYIDMAVVGLYDSLEEAEAAGAEDIKDKLFNVTAATGYMADFSGNGIAFTIFAEGEVYKYHYKVVVYEPSLSRDTFFEITGAEVLREGEASSGRKPLNENEFYIVPGEDDSYFRNGYQTVFIADGDVDLTNIAPTFTTGEASIRVRAGAGIADEISGQTTQDFSNGTVQYTALAGNNSDSMNYWVTFEKLNEGGSKLFVNGVNGPDGPKREVFLINSYNNLHDIFIANLGDAPLTGLKVTLSDDAENVALDGYWTVGGAGNDTLAPFTGGIPDSGDPDLRQNVAKIRLVPVSGRNTTSGGGDGMGDVSGTLTISADGQDDVVIELTGTAGDPTLVTEAVMPPAVRFVPYSKLFMHNSMYSENDVTIQTTGGELPPGMELKENGELYGTPKGEPGVYNFEVTLTNDSDNLLFSSEPVTASYTLEVLDNTNENVDNATDPAYAVAEQIGEMNENTGNYEVDPSTNQTFISNGEFSHFVALWLNGEKLTPGVDDDYTAKEGSVVAVIMAKTLQDDKYKGQTNTIAAEFRVKDDKGNETKELRRAAQNFVIPLPEDETPGGNGGETPGGSGGNDGETPGGSDGNGGETPGGNDDEEEEDDYRPSRPSRPTEPPYYPSTPTYPTPTYPTPTPIVAIPYVPAPAAPVPTPTPAPLRVLTVPPNSNTANLTAAELANAATAENASLTIDFGAQGAVILPLPALASMAELGQDLAVSFGSESGGSSVIFAAGGGILNDVKGGYRVVIPYSGTWDAIVSFQSTGAAEILKKSILKDGAVYAEADASGTFTIITNSASFTDVPSVDQYHDAVKFAAGRKIFNGVNAEGTLFAPNEPMTGSMIAAMLYRLEGSPVSETVPVFNGAAAGEWYSNAVGWAARTGLMSGDGGESADANISKEQFLVMMYRYADMLGVSTEERRSVSAFDGSADISGWAFEAARWAAAAGLIDGETALDPKGEASRGYVANVMMNFIDNMLK